MPQSAPRSVDLVEATPEWSGSDLLVLTTGSAPSGLALPFQRASVAILTARPSDNATNPPAGEAGDEAAATTYDTVVVDGPALGPALSVTALSRARTQVRPGGNVVVLPAETTLADTSATSTSSPLAATDPTDPVDLSGLVWVGVATLDGRLCAVLRADRAGSGSDILGRLETMARTLEVTGRRRAESQETSADARFDSETALLGHLTRLTRELAAETAARTSAEQKYASLERQHRTLERQHSRLKASKLGALTLRYWQLRTGVRRRLERRGAR
ncbi:hypothetical protein [Actinopolymorpha pittospori]|uniref:Uncharacterized protein n=1 Tax=Actinopolymorpha pittospori TaxID=648752 RepID=A0A927RGW2_9ACTN|nr:hypothetical protein [Actinopolymorpha pittospori]MBE1611610.1 hypothetical protein [Actinopolymorpha pittospori]